MVIGAAKAGTSSRRLAAVGWLGVYAGAVLTPLAVVFIGPAPEGRGFWTELSVALGFIGLATLGLQFAITGRFQTVAAPYGIDALLQFHRQIALVAGLLVLAHPLILFVRDPGRLALLNLVTAPWPARFGVPALVLLGLSIGLATWRRRLRIPYQVWRLSHGVLAVLIVLFALVHVELIGHYVDHPWKRLAWATMSLVMVGLLLHVRIIRPLMLLRRPYSVVDVRHEAGDATTLVLAPDGHEGMSFSPGQFAWLSLGSSPFTYDDHPFSFSSSAAATGAVEMTIKNLGDFTRDVQNVPVGRRAWLEGPHGAFTIDRYEGPGYVLIGGGVGITPLMSMLSTLADVRDSRPHVLIFAARTVEDLTFRERIVELEGRLDLDVVFVLSEPPEQWAGERGFVDAGLLARHVSGEWSEHLYFVCGPPPMMDAVERALIEHGVPLRRILTERFQFA